MKTPDVDVTSRVLSVTSYSHTPRSHLATEVNHRIPPPAVVYKGQGLISIYCIAPTERIEKLKGFYLLFSYSVITDDNV